MLAIADVAPDSGRGASRAGTEDDPTGVGMLFGLHLFKNRFGDVVITAPVGCPFGGGKLIHIIAAAFVGQPLGLLVGLVRRPYKMAAPAREFGLFYVWPR